MIHVRPPPDQHRTLSGPSPETTLRLPSASPASVGPRNISQAYGRRAEGRYPAQRADEFFAISSGVLAWGYSSVRSAMSIAQTVLARSKLRQERHVPSSTRGHDGVCGAHLHAAPDGAWMGSRGASPISMALLTELSRCPMKTAKNLQQTVRPATYSLFPLARGSPAGGILGRRLTLDSTWPGRTC